MISILIKLSLFGLITAERYSIYPRGYVPILFNLREVSYDVNCVETCEIKSTVLRERCTVSQITEDCLLSEKTMLLQCKDDCSTYSNDQNDDFLFLEAKKILPEDDLTLSKSRILKNYEFSKTIAGFVFENDKVIDVLIKKDTSSFKHNYGTLQYVNDNYTFYEQIDLFQTDVFLINYFGFEEQHFPESFTCFLTKNQTGIDLEQECKKLPRCIGFIENECLVNSVDFVPGKEKHASLTFFRKLSTHNVFSEIETRWFIYLPIFVITTLINVKTFRKAILQILKIKRKEHDEELQPLQTTKY